MKLPEERNYTPAPAGAHPAICIGFIDMGTQETMYGNKRQIRIRWELPTEQMQDGRPFTISQTYTWSMSSKSRLRGDLESWRGKPFEKSDFGKEGFDTKRLVGVPCLLNIIHKASGSEVYANISSISPIPKGMEKPTAHRNPLVYFSLDADEYDLGMKAILDELPEKMKGAIKESPEYIAIASGRKPDQELADFTNHDLDDEIPF